MTVFLPNKKLLLIQEHSLGLGMLKHCCSQHVLLLPNQELKIAETLCCESTGCIHNASKSEITLGKSDQDKASFLFFCKACFDTMVITTCVS